MDIQKVHDSCLEYLTHWEKPKSVKDGVLLGAKILSFVIFLIPCFAGLTLGATELILWFRGKKITPILSEDKPEGPKAVHEVALEVFTPDEEVSFTIDLNEEQKKRIRSSLATGKIDELVVDNDNFKDCFNILKYYLFHAKASEKTEPLTKQLLGLYDKLLLTGKEAAKIKRSWLERLIKKTPISTSPTLEQLVDPISANWRLGSDRFAHVSAKLLFQIQADEFGHNSSLEGMPQSEVLRYVASYMKARSSQNPHLFLDQKSLIEELETAKSIVDQKSLSKALEEAQKSQKPLIIPGGWVGVPSGHSIYYEIVPTSSTSASLRIFNTGEGISCHPRFQVGVKEKVGYAEWKNVSFDRLLNPHFSQIVMEMSSRPFMANNEPTKYCFEDIYFAMREVLNVSPDQCFNEREVLSAELMQPQRSGTCSLRSLMALIKSKMSRNEYRRFVADMRMESLSGFITQPEKPTKLTWRLVHKTVQKLSRKVDHLFQDKVVGNLYLQDAYKAISKATNWLDENKSSVFGDITQDTSFKFKNIDRPFKNRPTEQLDDEQQGVTQISINAEPISYLRDKVCQAPLDPQSILLALQKAFQQKEYISVQHAISDFVQRIAIDHEMLKKDTSIEPKKLHEMISDWNKIGELYFQSCFYTPSYNILFSEKLLTMKKILHIESQLAKKIDTSVTVNSGRVRYDFAFQYHDPQIRQEWDLMNENGGIFCDYYNVNYSNICIGEYQNESDKTSVLEHIMSNYPEALEKVRNDNQNYQSLGAADKRKVLAMSPHLPDWIKNVRDTEVRFQYLLGNTIASVINSDSAFDIKYTNVRGSIQATIGNLHQSNQHDHTKIQEFENAQQPFTNPLLERAYDLFETTQQGNEKKLLSSVTKQTVPGMSQGETKELLHIFSSANYSIIEAVEYFTKHPEKFLDSNYQKIFQMACFSSHHTFRHFPEQLARFLKAKMAFFREENELKSMIFILRINRYLSHFPKFENLLLNQTEWIINILSSPECTPEEKSMAYAEYAAFLGEKNSLTDEELTMLLIGATWLSNVLIPKQYKDPKTIWQVEKGLYRHSKAIESVLSKNPALLNKIYTEVTGKPSFDVWKQVSPEGMAPVFQSNQQDTFEPLKARLTTLHTEAYLPFEIRNSPAFIKLFAKQEKAEVLANGKFRFTDSLANTVVVQVKDNRLVIQTKRSDGWYQYVDRSACVEDLSNSEKSRFENRFLLDSCSAWQSLENPTSILLVDNTSYKPSYEVTVNNERVSKVMRLKDGALLGKPSNAFTRIEDPSYIQEWYDVKGQLVEVSLPRFSLTFTAKQDMLECTQMAGWYLCKNQTVATLGGSSHHLVLAGPQGKKRLILPDQDLEPSEKQEVLEPRYMYKTELEPSKAVTFNYFTYDLDSKERPRADTRAAYFHLIELLGVNQQYDLAAHYLRRHGDKLSAYSPEEKKRLVKVLSITKITGDESGEQMSLALYAAYLLSTNPSSSPTDFSNDLEQLYSTYLTRFKNITTLRLTKEEELRLLKNLLAIKNVPQFYIRLRELDQQYAADYKLDKKVKPAGRTPAINVAAYIYNFITCAQKRYVDELPVTLITRSASQIKKYFFTYMRHALNGTAEQKNWLETASTFLCHDQDQSNIALGYLFKEMLLKPSRFPVPPNELPDGYTKEFHAWQDSFSEVCATIATAPRLSETSVDLLRDITPDYYHLEKKPQPAKEIAFSLDAMSLTVDKVQDQIPVRLLPFSSPKEYTHELMGWLQEQTTAPIQKTPLISREYERLQRDLEVYANKEARPVYFPEQTLEEIRPILEAGLEQDNIKMQQLSDRLLFLANKQPIDAIEQKKLHLQIAGGVKKTITLDDIFISFAQKNPQRLANQNENLTEGDIKSLYTMASEYLQRSCNQQQRNKTLSLIDSQANEAQIGELLAACRVYNPENFPLYLVFEHYAGIYIRQEQIDKLQAFLQGGDSNPIMEMIMGSGKSKVLLPLLGLLRADGKNLSMLIVPAPLFESVSSDTQKILQDAFAKSLRTLHFDRNSSFNKRSLEEIRDILRDIIEKKECLIMTSKSVQSLLLKFMEYANSCIRKQQFLGDEMGLMQEIIGILTSVTTPLIDEADTVLNVLHEVSFSLGNTIPPNKLDIAVVGTLYDLLYHDPEIKALAQLESDPKPNLMAPPLTNDTYYNKVQRPLAEAFLKRLTVQKTMEQKTKDQLSAFLADTTNYNTILEYILRDKAKQKESMELFSKLPAELQDIFALAGEEISHLLPHTLLQISDEKFGLDGDVIAIPYAAANTANHGSLFANHYITMNYTFQTHIKKGISKQTLLEQVQKLKKQSDQEVTESGGTKLINETEAYKLFVMLRGDLSIPLVSHLNTQQLESLYLEVNKTSDTIQKIVQEVFLHQLELYEAKIACNPIGLTSLFAFLAGFTGTLWNAGSMHRKISAMPEEGTDARTIALLWKMSKDSDNVVMIQKGPLAEMLQDIRKINFDLISDSGGYFKEGGNLHCARLAAKQFQKPVVFYNSKNEQTVIDGEKEKSFAEANIAADKRITFLDQCHTTGSDVPQKSDATGIVSIGRNMLLRDLLQSVWRLRGLEKGQKVVFLVDNEVEAIIRQRLKLSSQHKVSFLDILRFVIENQCKQQGDDNFKSFKQQIWAMPQMLLVSILLDPNLNVYEKQQAFNTLRTTWIKSSRQSARDLYGQFAVERPSALVVKEEAEGCKSFLQSLAQQIPHLQEEIGKLTLEIDELVESTSKKVHPFVISPLSDDAETVEVEEETAAQMQMQVETQVSTQTAKIRLGRVHNFRESFSFKSAITREDLLDRYNANCFSLGKQLLHDNELKKYASLFDDIAITLNVLEWEEGEDDVAMLAFLGPHRTPFHHLLVDGDDVILATQEDENVINRNTYYNLTLGFNDPKQIPSEKAFQKITRIKFLNGESYYSKKELTYLETWIEKENVADMQELFEQHILRDQPEKAAAYQGSALQRIFGKLLSVV